MPHITVDDAKAWVNDNKVTITSLESSLEDAQATIVIARLSQAFVTTAWSDPSSTPSLVKKLIAMKYVGYLLDRTYAEDEALNAYATLLLDESEKLILGLIDGSVTLPDIPLGVNQALGRPIFYPTDESSALEADILDRSLGPAAFSMGQIF